jgi:hypothetical protein
MAQSNRLIISFQTTSLNLTDALMIIFVFRLKDKNLLHWLLLTYSWLEEVICF